MYWKSIRKGYAGLGMTTPTNSLWLNPPPSIGSNLLARISAIVTPSFKESYELKSSYKKEEKNILGYQTTGHRDKTTVIWVNFELHLVF